jgi:hypothetical protein
MFEESKDYKEIKNIIRVLKTLDWNEEDINKFLKIRKEDIRNLIKDICI